MPLNGRGPILLLLRSVVELLESAKNLVKTVVVAPLPHADQGQSGREVIERLARIAYGLRFAATGSQSSSPETSVTVAVQG